MKTTRRNHYRTLHVQPEAPAEIITASYRTLMQKLRAHPDLGGDPDTAVLINQAYAVLSDPERRARYDAELRRQVRLQRAAADAASGARAGAEGAAAGARAGSGTPRPGAPSSSGTRQARVGLCAWCTEPVPAQPRPDNRCARCQGPLVPPPTPPRGKHDLFGRRHAQRVARSSVVALFTQWGQPARGGRLRDLSLTGFSVLVEERVPEGQLVRINDDAMDVLGEVVACHREGRGWVLHARSTHAVFLRRAGAFVSTSA